MSVRGGFGFGFFLFHSGLSDRKLGSEGSICGFKSIDVVGLILKLSFEVAVGLVSFIEDSFDLVEEFTSFVEVGEGTR